MHASGASPICPPPSCASRFVSFVTTPSSSACNQRSSRASSVRDCSASSQSRSIERHAGRRTASCATSSPTGARCLPTTHRPRAEPPSLPREQRQRPPPLVRPLRRLVSHALRPPRGAVQGASAYRYTGRPPPRVRVLLPPRLPSCSGPRPLPPTTAPVPTTAPCPLPSQPVPPTTALVPTTAPCPLPPQPAPPTPLLPRHLE